MYKIAALALSFLSLAGSSIACASVDNVKFTAYGWPDASGIPAYKCSGNTVQTTGANDRTLLGDGSRNKPYAAAASANSIFKKCQLVYIPMLEKYFRVQDDCNGCVPAQLDLYIVQANSNIGQSQCELNFGTFNYGRPLHQVIKDDAPGAKIDTRPLFSNGHCYNSASEGRVYPNRDGLWKCPSSAQAKTESMDAATAEKAPTQDTPVPTTKDPASRHKGMKSIPPAT